MPQPSVSIVVFARMPVPGRAKTRLAAGVGPAAAAEFYRLCAQLIFHSAYSCTSADAQVFCSAAEDVTAMQKWLLENSTPMPVRAQQQTPDLGRRMLAALTAANNKSAAVPEAAQCCNCKDDNTTRAEDHDRAAAAAAAAAPAAASLTDSIADLQQNQEAPSQQQGQQQQTEQESKEDYRAVMVIGTDIPDLSAAVLEAAAAALATHNVVLGPACDGGFYLMGFRTEALLKPEVQSGQVFECVQWSTDSVLQRTVAGVQRLGLKLAPIDTLPVLQDVDTLQDLQAWYKQPELEHHQQQQQQDALVAAAGGKQVQQGAQDREQQHRQLLLQHACALLATQ